MLAKDFGARTENPASVKYSSIMPFSRVSNGVSSSKRLAP